MLVCSAQDVSHARVEAPCNTYTDVNTVIYWRSVSGNLACEVGSYNLSGHLYIIRVIIFKKRVICGKSSVASGRSLLELSRDAEW